MPVGLELYHGVRVDLQALADSQYPYPAVVSANGSFNKLTALSVVISRFDKPTKQFLLVVIDFDVVLVAPAVKYCLSGQVFGCELHIKVAVDRGYGLKLQLTGHDPKSSRAKTLSDEPAARHTLKCMCFY
jgi:hypothetical protein